MEHKTHSILFIIEPNIKFVPSPPPDSLKIRLYKYNPAIITPMIIRKNETHVFAFANNPLSFLRLIFSCSFSVFVLNQSIRVNISHPFFSEAFYRHGYSKNTINYRELTMPEAGTAHAVCCSVTSFLAFPPSVEK